MNIVVLGAGVIGTTAAYYLAKSGHGVTVIDRQPGPARETSFANGGQIVASHAEPWAGPGVPGEIRRALGRRDAPLLLRLRLDPALWRWGLRFLRESTAERHAANAGRNWRLALYGRAKMAEIRAETGIAYDGLQAGSLLVYRDAAAFERARRAAEALAPLGIAFEAAVSARCLAIEPALAPAGNAIAGGLYCAGDESGDAHAFTVALAEFARGLGVQFRFGETLSGFETARGRIAAAITDKGRIIGDAFVLALGSFGARFARRLGFYLPVQPIKGYAITAPLSAAAPAPRVALTDTATRVVLTRLGRRLRAAGTAETAGFDDGPDPARTELTLSGARALLPHAADYARAEPWSGLRPCTPDGVPLIGRSPVENLWLDTGHGPLGWTLAAASGALLADLVSGRAPDVNADDYAPARSG